MKEQFVTYEIALKLKELGFNEQCLANFGQDKYHDLQHNCENAMEGNFCLYDTDNLKAPLWQQVIDWFLKKKHLYIDITFKEVKGPKIEGINSVYFDIEIYSIFGGDAWKKYRFSEISDDYYYAREQAILKAIELCKE